MADRRVHRGAHPDDERLFSPREVERLRSASTDLCWLLTRGYSAPSSLKLVGDRHQLELRQRMAVMRAVCSDHALATRQQHELRPEDLEGHVLVVDGLNVLMTIEAALSGAVVISSRDGCYRDISSVHGSYRRVAETPVAIGAVGAFLESHGVGECTWLLDSPVSNTGRLKLMLLEMARERDWRWTVELHYNPDEVLKRSVLCVATADGPVLDCASSWFNLARRVVSSAVPSARIVELF